jgi:hypothetical protein
VRDSLDFLQIFPSIFPSIFWQTLVQKASFVGVLLVFKITKKRLTKRLNTLFGPMLASFWATLDYFRHFFAIPHYFLPIFVHKRKKEKWRNWQKGGGSPLNFWRKGGGFPLNSDLFRPMLLMPPPPLHNVHSVGGRSVTKAWVEEEEAVYWAISLDREARGNKVVLRWCRCCFRMLLMSGQRRIDASHVWQFCREALKIRLA